MLQIQQKLTPYNYTAMSNKKNTFIVVHYTGATGTAKNNVDYFAREKLSASASYFVDSKSIWQCVEDKNKAWHCGGGLQGSGGHSFYKVCTNSNSIGIEMCCKKDTAGNLYIEPETVNNTIDLIRYLMNKYGIPLDKVIRHYDVTGKLCPAMYVNETAWQNFKNKIKEVNSVAEFKDTKGHYAEAHINDLLKMGVVNGDGNGNFRPNDNIKRGDVAIMVRNAIRYITGK